MQARGFKDKGNGSTQNARSLYILRNPGIYMPEAPNFVSTVSRLVSTLTRGPRVHHPARLRHLEQARHQRPSVLLGWAGTWYGWLSWASFLSVFLRTVKRAELGHSTPLPGLSPLGQV